MSGPAGVSLRYVTIDVTDLDRAARFWSALLEVDVIARDAVYAWLAPQQPGGTGVVLQHVADPTPGKARCHLDLQPSDRVAARDRAVALGATVVGEIDEPGYDLTVLRDPEGVEFCILSARSRPGRSSASPDPG